MMNYKILVVDDESDICEILRYNLRGAGYEVDTAESAEEALRMDWQSYDLYLLDVMMGQMNGFTLANIIRSTPATADTPILFVTAADTEADTLKGFAIGADDYIAKPFRVKELVARVAAVLKRTASQPLSYNDLKLDVAAKRATIGTTDLQLTKTEFEILALLLSKPETVFSRASIISVVWPSHVTVLDRSVDVYIARLRKKLGIYSENVVSRSGYGYCFVK